MKFHHSDLFVFLEKSNTVFNIPDVIFTSFAECEKFAKSQNISGKVMSLSEALQEVYNNIRWNSYSCD